MRKSRGFKVKDTVKSRYAGYTGRLYDVEFNTKAVCLIFRDGELAGKPLWFSEKDVVRL